MVQKNDTIEANKSQFGLKPNMIIFILSLIPASGILFLAFTNQMGPDPLGVLQCALGYLSIAFLGLGISVQALNSLIKVEFEGLIKTLRILVAIHVALLFSVYIALNIGGDLTLLMADLRLFPWLKVMVVTMILIALHSIITRAYDRYFPKRV